MVVVENEVFGASDTAYMHLVAHSSCAPDMHVHNRETGENSATVCAQKAERYLFLALIDYKNVEVDIVEARFSQSYNRFAGSRHSV